VLRVNQPSLDRHPRRRHRHHLAPQAHLCREPDAAGHDWARTKWVVIRPTLPDRTALLAGRINAFGHKAVSSRAMRYLELYVF
jgi:hypothetical protein